MIKSRIAPNIERNRIESLTGLRFFAALAVLLCHYQALAPPTSLNFLLDAGGHGVLLFFMLSGFVLTHRYDRLQATASSNAWLRSSVYSYVLARVARVVPLYWLVLGVTVVVYFASNFVYALGPQPEGSIGIGLSLLVNFLALQSWIPSVSVQQFWNAPGWSISCEMFFYACFPWLIRRLTLNGSTWSFVRVTVGFAFAFFIYAAVLHIFSAWTRLSLEVGFRLPLFGLFPFILGILIHRRMRNGFSSKDGLNNPLQMGIAA